MTTRAPLVTPTPASPGAVAARREFLPFAPPLIGEEEIREVVDTLKSDWITTGPKTRRFEQEFAAYLGAPAALALNSCTAALHTALVTLGIRPGDEVITTPTTFAASVGTFTPEGTFEAAIPRRTKAVLPVHYAGHPVALDRIGELARAGGFAVVEDAAHALAAKYRGRPIGADGNPTAFSFYATKNLTTAEGGMLTGGPEFLERARIVSLHGMNRDAWKRYDRGGHWYYEVVTPGFKYNMTDIQAALGVWQLRKLPGFQERRRAVAGMYDAAFAAEDALELPARRPDVEHAWHLYVLRLRPEALRIGRDAFIEELRLRNIGTSVHFIPIHLHPYYRDKYGYRPDSLPVAHANYQRMLSLPLNARLSDSDARDVIEAVLDVVRRHRR